MAVENEASRHATLVFEVTGRRSPGHLTQKAVVLCYHSTPANAPPDPAGRLDPWGLTVTADVFGRHMEALSRRHRLVPLQDLVAAGDRRTAHSLVAITFDDGYSNNYEEAHPILQRLGIPATVFVVTRYVESGSTFWLDRFAWHLNRFAGQQFTAPPDLGGATLSLASPTAIREALVYLQRRLQRMEGDAREDLLDRLGIPRSPCAGPLSWKQLADMQRGGVTVGVHSHSHSSLRAIPRAMMVQEIALGKKLVTQRLGTRPKLFAYPFGEAGRREAEGVSDAGFAAAVTTEATWYAAGSRRFFVPRLVVGNWDTAVLEDQLERLSAPLGVIARLRMRIPRPIAARLKRIRETLTAAGRRTINTSLTVMAATLSTCVAAANA